MRSKIYSHFLKDKKVLVKGAVDEFLLRLSFVFLDTDEFHSCLDLATIISAARQTPVLECLTNTEYAISSCLGLIHKYTQNKTSIIPFFT